MPASSATFEAVLLPDPRLRRRLRLCALLSLPAGLAIIVTSHWAAWLQGLAAALFAAASVREYRELRLGAARVARYALDARDGLAAIAADGQRTALVLLPGSVVLARLAWLRLRFPDGRHYVELLRQMPGGARDWQCLQLVWRLRRAVFGAQEGS